GCPGIEANLCRTAHERVVTEPLVLERIANHHGLVGMQDGMRTEGHFARRFGQIHTNARLEPLSIAVYQRDECNGRPADGLGQRLDVVKRLLWKGVENT